MQIKKTRRVVEEVEIEFPLFLKGDDDFNDGRTSWQCWYRFEEDGRLLTVNETRDIDSPKLKRNLELSVIDLENNLDHYLTSVTYSRITKEEFDRALKETLDAVTDVTKPQ